MALARTNDILQHATEHHYGVVAINTLNFETVRNAVKAAEAEKVPIIIQFFPGFETYIPLKHISYMAKDLAQKASVPVAVHLDHSAGFDIAVGGIRDGFPSVMVDGSSLPYEENVKLTSEVVRVARVFGVDIEAELGHVGSASNLDDIVNVDHYTSVDQAVQFVQRTGCDSLAVAVGNAHGDYVQKPNLDFARMRELRRAISIPLVLHGCSGIPDDQMAEAVNIGFSKFNVATEYFAAMYHGLEQVMAGMNKADGFQLMSGLQEPMIAFVRKKIRLLNPNGITPEF